jgi:FkbM family methyltransferase
MSGRPSAGWRARELFNKASYAIMRANIHRDAKRRGLSSALWHPHHWTRFPIRLEGTVRRSPHGYLYEVVDPESIEQWDRLERYEPVSWFDPLPGQVVIDVGAFEGRYTIASSISVGKLGTVLAFEPDPRSRRALIRNLALNDAANVIVVPGCAWKEAGHLNLSVSEHRVWSRVEVDGPGEVVAAHAVDDLVQGLSLNRVDWMKLDVEGAECEVLEGSSDVLSRFQPTIFVEVHGTRSDLNRLLGAVGYAEVSWLGSGIEWPGGQHGWVLAAPEIAAGVGP